MDTENLTDRGRRWLVALIVATCLAVPAMSLPMFSSREPDEQSTLEIDLPILAGDHEEDFGGG